MCHRVEGVHYDVTRYYNNYSREYQTFDASGNGIKRRFNTQGYFYQANDLSSTYVEGSQLYAVLAMDASGRVTSDKLGGTLISRAHTFDVLGRPTGVQSTSGVTLQNLTYSYWGVGNSQYGNLYQRKDLAKTLTETFNYDGLNRLTSSQVSGQSAATVSYDSFGNIMTKSGQGMYSYGTNAGPHAATSVAGNTNTYDANGNYTGTTTGTVRTVTYNVFDKPLVMTRGSNGSTFTYGPDRDYYKRVDVDSGVTKKTLYLIGVEKVYKADGTRDERRYLPGGAYQIKTYNSSNVLTGTTVEYLLDNHQDSIDVIADASGAVKQKMSFDAWGMRRNPDTWVALTTAQVFDNSQTSHGYTGHEMVDNVDIIHMHGRIYDARWGRMLQADPYIQEEPSWMMNVPGLITSQAQNRYAYVNNNPLIHTDPTGYCTVGEAVSGCHTQHVDGTQRMLAASPTANGLAGVMYGDGSFYGGGLLAGGQNVSSAKSQSLAAGTDRGGNGGLKAPRGSEDSATKLFANGAKSSGLSANFSGANGEFTTEAPEELIRIRKEHPELVATENAIWEKSQPTGLGGFLGIGEQPREQSLVVYQNNADGSLLLDRQYKAVFNPNTGHYSSIPLPPQLPVPSGYNLLLIEHTHPFPYCFACQAGGLPRGPSSDDARRSRQYPNAFHIIQSQPPANMPREWNYYGPRVGR